MMIFEILITIHCDVMGCVICTPNKHLEKRVLEMEKFYQETSIFVIFAMQSINRWRKSNFIGNLTY